MQHCPNCGAAAAPDSVYCPRCGAALSPDAPKTAAPNAPPGTGGGGGTGKTVMWVAVGCGCLFVGIIVLGILAAIAIPKFASVSAASKEAEAEPILKQIVMLQGAHQQEHGRYTDNLETPSRSDHLAGWADPGARYYTFWVSRATEDALCVTAELSPEGAAANLSTFSMDADGTLHRGPDCSAPEQGTGEPVWEDEGESVPEEAPATEDTARPAAKRVPAAKG